MYGVVKTSGSVVIAAVNDKKELYLIRQWRYPLGKLTLELPWGGIDRGESPLQAAKRELHEEAGIRARRWTSLGAVALCPGVIDEVAIIFCAQGLTIGKPTTMRSDGIEKVIKIPLERARRWALSGKIKDAVAISGIVRADARLKI